MKFVCDEVLFEHKDCTKRTLQRCGRKLSQRCACYQNIENRDSMQMAENLIVGKCLVDIF